MIYGECVVDIPHLVRLVRLYETERVASETHKGKRFLRETNRVVRGSEHSLLYVSFI